MRSLLTVEEIPHDKSSWDHSSSWNLVHAMLQIKHTLIVHVCDKNHEYPEETNY